MWFNLCQMGVKVSTHTSTAGWGKTRESAGKLEVFAKDIAVACSKMKPDSSMAKTHTKKRIKKKTKMYMFTCLRNR